jgi:hypothetical protein
MTQDEIDILVYFRANPTTWVTFNELSRLVGGKYRFNQDPEWPRPILKKFAAKDLLEKDASGAYRVKPKKKKEHKGPRIFVTPEIAEALRRAGKTWKFEVEDEDPDDEYDLFLRTGKLQTIPTRKP